VPEYHQYGTFKNSEALKDRPFAECGLRAAGSPALKNTANVACSVKPLTEPTVA